MSIFKKNTEKHTEKLPMTGKVKKGFRIYCTAIMGAALVLGTYPLAANVLLSTGGAGLQNSIPARLRVPAYRSLPHHKKEPDAASSFPYNK